jgi:hypothetical protein
MRLREHPPEALVFGGVAASAAPNRFQVVPRLTEFASGSECVLWESRLNAPLPLLPFPDLFLRTAITMNALAVGHSKFVFNIGRINAPFLLALDEADEVFFVLLLARSS